MSNFKFLCQWRRYMIALCMAIVTSLSLFAQGISVSGTVTDEGGESLPGVNVTVSGTSSGVVTNAAGKFNIVVPDEASVLVFSFVGYTTQEITVGSQRDITVSMVEGQQLDEVVVVGYGTQKKANLTGAVATVNEDVLEGRPLTNLGSGLQGVLGNLNITQSNGQPGTGATFNIRGTTNFAGSGPLVLVDGIEMDPNLLNPQDVKSVTVLKDAASAAIYGARAAFGVILIQTKTGFVTKKPTVSFSANYSTNVPTSHAEYMNSMEYANWMNNAMQTTNSRDYYDAITMQHIKAYFDGPENNPSVFRHPDDTDPNIYRLCGNTDWYKTLNKYSYPIQQYNINITGGSKSVKYYTSAGFFKQDGISKWANEDFKRFNVMQNVSYTAKDKPGLLARRQQRRLLSQGTTALSRLSTSQPSRR